MGKIPNPPLIKFLLRIYFDDIDYPTIHELSSIYKELSKDYPDPTRIRLISSKGPETEFIFSPIRFLSKEEDNEIMLFKDALFFQYNNKYSSWDEIFPNLMTNLQYLAKKLHINQINRISFDYTDLFTQFPRNGFNIRKFFNIDLVFPIDYELDYEDFIVGVRLNIENENHKSIIRLRGLAPEIEDKVKIQLESHYSIIEEMDINNNSLIEENFNHAHKELRKNFSDILSQQTKILIGMDDEQYSN